MPITRSRESNIGAVFEEDDYDSNEESNIREHCIRCYDMTRRLNYLGPLVLQKDEPEPEDYDDWRQCPACGSKYLRTEVSLEHEGELSDFVEIDDARKDSVVESLFERVRARDGKSKPRRKTRLQRFRERQIKDAIKDPDVWKALKSGQRVVNYSEYQLTND